MKIEDVAKLSPLDRFLYWVKERHRIYVKRERGRPKPWTDDEVLQNFFFTNPYRENDKTTIWFRKNVRDPMKDNPDVLLATVIFRWFNLIETGMILNTNGWLTGWRRREVEMYFQHRRDIDKKKIFTGAFMINSPGGEPKLEAICRRINNVWKDRKNLIPEIEESPSLQIAHEVLTEYEGLGGFMAYEIVCDLRYTYLLENATDIMTWANPGPGCIRGLYRLAGEEIVNKSNSTSPPKPKNFIERMKKLLATTQRRLSKMPKFEMREIEHSLCEFDKYERVRLNEGRSKRKYNGT